nr:PQQ-binding-like beta-propeller repeat protein [Mucilaginibacter sp. L294]
MKKINLSLNKQLFTILLLSLISFSIACKKDSTPTPNPDAPGNYTVYFGAQDNNFYALNGTDGTQIWKYESTGNFSYSTPIIENGVIYTTNTDHNLYALNAKTGALKWKFASNFTTISSPAIANGIVYFGSDDHNVYAVDAITGSLKWKYTTGYNVDSSPLVLNGVVYIGSSDGYLYALDATSGSLKWDYNTGGPIVKSNPEVSNGVVFIGSRNGLLSAVDVNNGELKWSFNTNGISLEHAVITANNGVIYFASWSDLNTPNLGGSLYAVKETDGSLVWKGLDEQGFSSGPIYANGKLYVNSDDSNLYAVDAATGQKIWKTEILANGSLPTAIFGKVFSSGGGNGFFYALDAGSGAVSWKFPIPNSITTSKALVVAETGTAN